MLPSLALNYMGQGALLMADPGAIENPFFRLFPQALIWPAVALASSGVVYQQATTMTLAAIVFCQIGAVLNCRTDLESVFTVGLFSNRQVLVGIAVELALLSAIIYVPLLQGVFGTTAIGPFDWLYLIVLPIPMVLLDELRKGLARRRAARSKKASSGLVPAVGHHA